MEKKLCPKARRLTVNLVYFFPLNLKRKCVLQIWNEAPIGVQFVPLPPILLADGEIRKIHVIKTIHTRIE